MNSGNSGLMDLGFGNLSGGPTINSSGLSQGGFGQGVSMGQQSNSMTFGMNSSANMGMGNLHTGSSDIFKGMNVKSPTT